MPGDRPGDLNVCKGEGGVVAMSIGTLNLGFGSIDATRASHVVRRARDARVMA